MNEELDEAVNDILSQLKNTTVIKQTPVTDTLTKEKLEEFLIKNSGKLVTDSINLIDDMRDFVGTADADPESISALAELIKAASLMGIYPDIFPPISSNAPLSSISIIPHVQK